MANENHVHRAYTPINSPDQKGTIELLVKTYPNGEVSQRLDSLAVGDKVDMRGPIGPYVFTPDKYENVLMICGGTGITPFFQILQDPSTQGKVSLLCANNKEEDILLKKEIEDLKIPTQHVLLEPPPNSKNYLQGYLTQEILQEQIKGKDFILICGPPKMEESVSSIISSLGVSKNNFHCFSKGSPVIPLPPKLNVDINTRYTLAEVNKHNTEQDCWMVIKNQVYDVTNFIEAHPGGSIILEAAGIDATTLFYDDFPHSEGAEELLHAYCIGELAKDK